MCPAPLRAHHEVSRGDALARAPQEHRMNHQLQLQSQLDHLRDLRREAALERQVPRLPNLLVQLVRLLRHERPGRTSAQVQAT